MITNVRMSLYWGVVMCALAWCAIGAGIILFSLFMMIKGGETVSAGLAISVVVAAVILLIHNRFWRPAAVRDRKNPGEFDAQAYANLPRHEKIALLAKVVGADTEMLALILGFPAKDIERYLTGGEAGIYIQVICRADCLLSVLGYLLRIAEYKPAQMAKLWTAVDFYKGSAAPPPWDRFGLKQYLTGTGVKGLHEALMWIRSH